MDRREAIKTLSLGTLAAGFVITGCEAPTKEQETVQKKFWDRITEEELEMWDTQFFTDHEFATVRQMANMIIPADDRSGNAEDAGVPQFIDFMMLDRPIYQTPIRGGLNWVDYQCEKMFGNRFIACSDKQKTQFLDQIAYPDIAKPEMKTGVTFFNRFRDLVASGFWSSKIGIEDIEYIGNEPHGWNGCTDEALEHLGLPVKKTAATT